MMKDLTLSKEEAAEEASCDPVPPKYPYGTCLDLDDETITKLGLDGLQAGTKVNIQAIGTVVGTRTYQTQGGDAESSLSIQITAMDVEGVQGKNLASKMYPGMKSETDD